MNPPLTYSKRDFPAGILRGWSWNSHFSRSGGGVVFGEGADPGAAARAGIWAKLGACVPLFGRGWCCTVTCVDGFGVESDIVLRAFLPFTSPRPAHPGHCVTYS